MNLLVKNDNRKLAFDVAAIMRMAHENSKATAEYLNVSYAEAFKMMLKQAWAVAKLEMKDCVIADGVLKVTVYPIGGVKEVGNLRSQW